MIAYLVGKVIERGRQHAVILTGGVGYEVKCAPSIPNQGADVMLYVHSITKEETGTRLYGFASYEERAAFVQLLGVEGVGPTTAMNLLSHMGTAALTAPALALCAVKGVGKKTAEKIVEALHAE